MAEHIPFQLPDHLGGITAGTSIAEVAIGNVFNDRKRKMSLCADEPHDSSAQQISKIPKVIRTESIVVSHQNSLAGGRQSIMLSHVPAPQSIDLIVHKGDSSAAVLSLARFPKEIDISHTKSTVLWPSNHNSSLQVIITDPPKLSYNSDEINASLLLPAVVSRDPRSIAPPRDTRSIAPPPDAGGSPALHLNQQQILQWDSALLPLVESPFDPDSGSPPPTGIYDSTFSRAPQLLLAKGPLNFFDITILKG
jgi:hypothetical protein